MIFGRMVSGYIFFQTTISVLQIMSTEVRLIWKNARKASILHRGLFLLFGGSGRENCERGRTLGLGVNELNLIKSVAENDIRSAKNYTIQALAEKIAEEKIYE